MTIANLVGGPLGTYLAHIFSWRDVFYVIALLNTGVLLALFTWLPDVGGLKDTGFKEQFVFLKSPAPWLILAATAFGNGGIFVMFSYLSPLLTDWSGLNVANVPWVMMLAGLAMVLFNLLSGQLCDRFTPGKVAFAFQSLAVLGLLLLALTGSKLYLAISLICFCSGVLFALSAPQQIAILQTAQGGMLLGAALIQAAFNLGNALGATVGGFPFSLHWPYYSVPLIGALVACLGAISLYLYSRFYEPTLEPAPSRA